MQWRRFWRYLRDRSRNVFHNNDTTDGNACRRILRNLFNRLLRGVFCRGSQENEHAEISDESMTSRSPIYTDKFYNMNHKHRGIALILNHEHFDDEEGHESRLGTDKDVERLTVTLKKLNFNIILHNNLTYNGMLNALTVGQ